MKFTFYGHACFSIEVAGKTLLFDPFISPNEKAKDIDIDSISADYILISHGHYDHIADAEQIAKKTGAKVVSNFEIITWLQNKGVENTHPMNHGGSWKFDFGTVKYVNAVHSSALPDGSDGGNPGGFVVETVEGIFYYAGDTALTMDMKLIPHQFKLDFSILPIGDNFTMGYHDAIIAAEFVQCSKIIGIHFDTFPYIEVDHEQVQKAFENDRKELILPKIGETIEL